MHYVYVLENLNKSNNYYFGYTADLKRRLEEHNRKSKHSYTRGREWKLVYYEAYLNEKYAKQREYRLKHNGRMRDFLMKRVAESLSVI